MVRLKSGFKIQYQLLKKTTMESKPKIDSFKGEHRWLSNFHMCSVEFEGLVYPSTEHAYQAAKTLEPGLRLAIKNLPEPKLARRAGQLLDLTEDWHTTRKFAVMKEVCTYKFTKHPDLREKLLETKDIILIEGNNWHDNIWGCCFCARCNNQGQNHLGKLLMEIREALKNEKEEEKEKEKSGT